MTDKNLVIWLILLAILSWCIYWHIHENRQLSQQWHKQFDDISAQWLTRFAWMRSIQFLAALTSCVVLIIAYGWQLSMAQNSIEDMEKKNAEYIKRLAAQVVTPAAIPLPVAPVMATPKTTPTENINSQTNLFPPRDTSVVEIYNPEEQISGNQSAIDGMKKRYEDILVIYFFLKKCHQINPSDYYIIVSALAQEMASANAPGRLQSDILTAAQGSYTEMYAQTDCKADGIASLQKQYANYIDTLSKQYIVP